MTNKEIAAHVGRGLTWLKTHECNLCGQLSLYALKYGCGSLFGPKCDPFVTLTKPIPETARGETEEVG